MTDWADAKAREWLKSESLLSEESDMEVHSLAALLREVSEESASIQYEKRKALLAEVRRVVEGVRARAEEARLDRPSERKHFGYLGAECDEILARLEKL